jgi:hypothetical protein
MNNEVLRLVIVGVISFYLGMILTAGYFFWR